MTNIRRALVSKPLLAALFSTLIGGAGSVALAQAPAQPAAQPAPLTVPERVAALKASLGKSMASLR